jgi:hypothetical protein
VQQQAGLRASEAKDLQHALEEVSERQRGLGTLHDLVRNQRNKLIHLINAARQGVAEMANKLKVLEAEEDILRGGAASRAGLLKQVSRWRPQQQQRQPRLLLLS